MRKLLTDEMMQYLKDNIAGSTHQEITDQINTRFGTNFTKEQIANLAVRKGIKNGMWQRRSVFPEHIRKFMAENCKGNRAREMVVLLNDTFGTDYTEKQISSYYRKHGLKSGVASRYVPIGTLIFRKGEWYYEKVADGPDPNKNWKSKHIMVWEEAHGPVPEGHMVIFLDGDRRHYQLENLALCPYDVGLEMNHKNLRFDNAQLTETGMLIAKVNLQARRRQKKRGASDE
ncbi:MAG: HNH endonuclease [Oscillospiraceae bacterium]|nr:HNH endonuclease [Oscillospiraceae bacterium]